jgi:aldehyde dehydrogenase (NAD+)
MQEEIFGPLLPILEYENFNTVIEQQKTLEKPLSLYLFTKDKKSEDLVLTNLNFGNGCINDCLIQYANPELPFGGVGQSGLGRYHGYYSFETFSHFKSVVKRGFLFDMKVRYPPYTKEKTDILKKVT